MAFHTTECNYNPYIAKWKDEVGYKPPIECGIVVNEKDVHVGKDLLTKTIESIYYQ